MKHLLACVVGVLFSGLVLAESASVKVGDHVIQRVGGSYRVEAVTPRQDGGFDVRFVSPTPSGRFDVLRLESDHMNVAVQQGDVVRLSAEVEKEQGALADVSQVVMFLPAAEGPVPVWLLSRHGSQVDLRATKYLKMHSPQSDYTIF